MNLSYDQVQDMLYAIGNSTLAEDVLADLEWLEEVRAAWETIIEEGE